MNYREIFDQVVRDIINKKLKHNQEVWHCGTAHCVCGWFEIRAMQPGETYNPKTELFSNGLPKPQIMYDTAKQYGLKPNDRAGIVSKLTGYSVEDLTWLFCANNELYHIKYIAKKMGIYDEVKNNTSKLAQVKGVSAEKCDHQSVGVSV